MWEPSVKFLVPVLVSVLVFRGAGLKRQGMEVAAHLALQRLVDHLVLLDPRLALEQGGHDVGGIVVAVAGEIPDLDRRAGRP